jgi:hypothetical protein
MEHEATLFHSSNSMMSVGEDELSSQGAVREAITAEEQHINFLWANIHLQGN